MDMEHIKPSTM